MGQRDYEAWKGLCIAQGIAAGFWPWKRDLGSDPEPDPIDTIDSLSRKECRMRWWQNRCDLDAGIPLTFALTPAQVAVAKSSLGLRDATRRDR
jgi:hypothetical protein